MIERIRVADDVELAADVAAPSNLPVLVLSNSIGANFHMWDEVVPLLAGRLRLIRYDTRGHGLSDTGSGAITLETLGRDIITILDRIGIQKAVLCGLSLGGITAQWLGSAFSERFHGLILANTAANFPPASMWLDRAKAVREQGLAPLVPPSLDRWFTKAFQQRRPERVAEIAEMIKNNSIEGYARCCELLAEADVREAIKSITLPTRVICGEHDPSTPPARGQEIVSLIPNADMKTLNAAHVSSIEAPEAFANAVLSFVDKLKTT